MKTPPIVSPQEWVDAWEKMLVKEKELTRARDGLAAERRRMPWMTVEKDHRFEGPNGPASLADLFEGRRQLIVYRAFYARDVTTYPEGGGAYPERACVGCSFVADQVAHPAHLNARDTTLAFVSRAPQAEIQGLKERMGWELIPWYTITDDFDKDFGVDEWHGTNAFIRDGDRIFRTYLINSQGDEAMGSAWSYLDITALGRQEEWEDSPEGYPQTPPYQWWNYHDAYGDPSRERSGSRPAQLRKARVATRIPARDLQRARSFYADRLGLEPAEERPGGLLYRCANGEFALFESAGASPGTFTQMGWEVDDLEATVAELRERGVEFEEVNLPGLQTTDGIAEVAGNYPSKGTGERAAWFRDSEGNMLGIGQPIR